MTIYYVSSVDGDNASDGLSWTNAFLTFKYAVETASAAASGPHILYVDSAHNESLTATATIVLAGDLRIISVDRTDDSVLAGAVVGAQSATYSITMDGGKNVYCYGITFRYPGTGAVASQQFGLSDLGQYEFEQCQWLFLTTNSSQSPRFGYNATNINSYTKLKNCTFRFSHASGFIRVESFCEMEGCTLDPAGTGPTTLFSGSTGTSILRFNGCDFSDCTGTLFANYNAGATDAVLINCKLGSGVTFLTAATTPANKGNITVTAYNCNSGDAHYSFYHGDAFGSTTAQTTIYATAGAQTNSVGVAYAVVTTANCSYFTPYVGPWLAKAHTGTSAVTPSFEILRDGSATAYQDDEVWGEWSYQGTTGYPLANFVNDRMAVLGTAANQATGALAAGDWTGENATAWFGKLAPGSTITPAESGCIYGRVVVGEPSITVYFDPQIRVA